MTSERVIKKMPDRETLEEFMEGLHRSPTVIFNKDKGEFERTTPRKEHPQQARITKKK